jgi:hypothetical protein
MTQAEKDDPSANTPRRSRMQLVGERQTADAPVPSPTTLPSTPRTTSSPSPAHLQQEYIHRAAWKAGLLGALNVATAILAARLVVLVAVGGAIVLTWLALAVPDPVRLGALGIYCVAVVIPCIWLAGRR